MSDYPEHDKMAACQAERETVGAFLEWLGEQGFVIGEFKRAWHEYPCNYRDRDAERASGMPWRVLCTLGRLTEEHYVPFDDKDLGACPKCNGTGIVREPYVEEQLVPVGGTIADMLARYLGIDQAKIEDEKRAMLDALRAMNTGAAR